MRTAAPAWHELSKKDAIMAELPYILNGQFFVINLINSKNKRKSTSKEASELVGSLLGLSESEDNEDNNGPNYSSPSKKVKEDFFDTVKSEFFGSGLHCGRDGPMYTVEKPSFKNMITGLSLYVKVPGRKALAGQIEAKFLKYRKIWFVILNSPITCR